jgi:hypothetical protein
MKTKLLFTIILCLLFFTFTSLAQRTEQVTVTSDDYRQHEQSPKMEIGRQAGMRAFHRAQWEGANPMVQYYILNTPDIREAWGITDEQYQQVQNLQMSASFQNFPEFQAQVAMYDQNDPFMYNADEETLAKYRDVTERLQMKLALSSAEAVDNILTADQRQMVNEFTISTSSGSVVFAPSMFEALGLTDDQRQEMEKIKKEFEPQFEKNIEEEIITRQIGEQKWRDELEKRGMDPTKQLTGQQMMEIGNEMMENDPEFAKISHDAHANRVAFSTQFKTKMFDVLTDEQWDRFEKLVGNFPEYYTAHLKKWQAGGNEAVKKDETQGETQKGEGKKVEAEKPIWTPGPNSWRPGDPIPEEYRQERTRRRGGFPRAESVTEDKQ